MGLLNIKQHNFEDAKFLLTEGISFSDKAQDDVVKSYVYLNLGHLHSILQDVEASTRYQHMCLELAQRRTDLRLEMIVLANMAYNRILKNDYTTSLNLSQRAEVLAQRIDEKRFQASIKGNLGYAYWQLGYYQMGEVYYREHLKLSYEQGIMDNFVENLFELSGFWKHMNFDRQAQILWEIAENLRLYYNYAIFHDYENIKLQVFGKITPTQPDGNVSIYQQDLVAALQ